MLSQKNNIFIVYKPFIHLFMKAIRLCFYLFVFGSFHSLFAQEESGTGMLFPRFEDGIVLLKNGEHYSASFNYDMVMQEMLFQDGDNPAMIIGNPLDVIAVTVEERRFVPASSQGLFYEVMQAGEELFFVQRKARLISKGKAAPFGGYSQTSSATSIINWQSGGNTVTLKSDEKFKLEIQYIYYLKSGNRYKGFSSARTLGKLFKGHESEIKEFADKHSIDFEKTEDVARIVEYGYSLIK